MSKAETIKIARATVRAMEIRRTFHQGRVSGTSKAALSACAKAFRPLEAAHKAASKPNDNLPPPRALVTSSIVITTSCSAAPGITLPR